jgi:hypothetical protein
MPLLTSMLPTPSTGLTHSGPAARNTHQYLKKLGFKLMSSCMGSSPLATKDLKFSESGRYLIRSYPQVQWYYGSLTMWPIPSQVPQHGSWHQTLQVEQDTLPLLCCADNMISVVPKCYQFKSTNHALIHSVCMLPIWKANEQNIQIFMCCWPKSWFDTGALQRVN